MLGTGTSVNAYIECALNVFVFGLIIRYKKESAFDVNNVGEKKMSS